MKSGTFERRARNLLAAVIGTAFPARKTSASTLRADFAAGRIRKVLFVRPHQGLGDLLLASPVFRAVKAALPSGGEVHFLAEDYNQVAIATNPHFSKVWVWEKRAMQRPASLWRFLRGLWRERFDLAIPLSSHTPSFTSFWLARASGARWVVGFDTEPFYGGANWSRHLTHYAVPLPAETTPQYETFMELLKPFGIQGSFAPEFAVTVEAQKWAAETWRRLGHFSERRKVGVFLGGNPDRPERLWPAEAWANYLNRLLTLDNVAAVAITPPDNFISGSRALERGVAEVVLRHLSRPVPTVAERDLVRLAAFLKGLDLFVCVDGGLYHVAVAAGVPTLGLFFKTDPAQWMPPVPWTRVLRPADEQPRSLSAAEVAEATQAWLAVDLQTSNFTESPHV
jgi:heptosyltransferase III